jgi:hypothetical protein
MNDFDLTGAGAALVFLREARIQDDAVLRATSADNQRNAVIVTIAEQTKRSVPELQGLRTIDLVLQALGHGQPAVTLIEPSYIRGVLLAGKFRTQHELNVMSADDQRNTLIVELSQRTNQPVAAFQAMNDFDLAGAGAALVFLREARIQDDAVLKATSADNQRNAVIVTIAEQTKHAVSDLQGLRTMDLVLSGLGVEPVFPAIPPKRYVFSVDSVEIRRQKADNDHSDSDWLSIVVSIGNPITKNIQTLPAKLHHIEGNIKTGNVIAGAFVTDSFIAEDSDVVVITYLLTNLGSSDAEKQFAQAVKVTDKVVGIIGPIVGAAIGLFFGAPGQGFKIGQEIAKGFDTAISTLSDAFDFLGIHAGPPNCNGEVLHDTLTFQPGELAQAVNHPASREYTGPQENDRCGGAPESKVNFSVLRPAAGGLIAPNPALESPDLVETR